ncbi:hypothetical protein ACFT9I_12995 [Streptomyces sp. NPDC057137]|uniref:hypothetical protein n=1 Tax=Streptomyces sp. NPDC057137 TaxID=3346030 RepID=UPI003631A813
MTDTTERDWDDDTEYHAALARAERLTRFGWTTMTGLLALLALAMLAPVLVAALGILTVLSMNY